MWSISSSSLLNIDLRWCSRGETCLLYENFALRKGHHSLKSAGRAIHLDWVFLALSEDVVNTFYPLDCFVERMWAELVLKLCFKLVVLFVLFFNFCPDFTSKKFCLTCNQFLQINLSTFLLSNDQFGVEFLSFSTLFHCAKSCIGIKKHGFNFLQAQKTQKTYCFFFCRIHRIKNQKFWGRSRWKFSKFSLKSRAIFENVEKDQERKRFQFDGVGEGGNFWGRWGTKFWVRWKWKFSKFSLKFIAIFENFEKHQKKTDIFNSMMAAKGGN